RQGSPRAVDIEGGVLELPYIPEDPYLEAALQAPPSPDYVPGPEEPEQAPLSPDYVPGPEYADDEIVAEDQPGAEDAPPTAQSPDYVPDTDPEADPEEDDDEDPEEDPIDYPADGGDDGDDEMDIDEDDDMDIDADEEDEDDEMDVEVDEEAEEEHSAPAYPVVVALPATAPSASRSLSPFETVDVQGGTPPPHPAYRMTARHHKLSPWSSSPPQIPFPLSPPLNVLTALPLLYHFPFYDHYHNPSYSPPPGPDAPLPCHTSAPTSFPPLLLPSASHREDRPEVNLPPWKRLGIALGPSYEVGESSAAAAARPGWEGAPVSTVTEWGAHTEARMSREAWGKYMDASDLAHAEVMSLRTTVHAQMSEINELHTTERDDSTSGTGHHTAGAGDSFTGTGDDITGAGYCITGTAGTRWGSCTARAARGGW
ncbi:hypothetical protein Tco_0327979, partial [Tanacetum coccineum]